MTPQGQSDMLSLSQGRPFVPLLHIDDDGAIFITSSTHIQACQAIALPRPGLLRVVVWWRMV